MIQNCVYFIDEHSVTIIDQTKENCLVTIKCVALKLDELQPGGERHAYEKCITFNWTAKTKPNAFVCNRYNPHANTRTILFRDVK